MPEIRLAHEGKLQMLTAIHGGGEPARPSMRPATAAGVRAMFRGLTGEPKSKPRRPEPGGPTRG